jgi:hypothetical protein
VLLALEKAIAAGVDRCVAGDEDAVDAVPATLSLAEMVGVRPDLSHPQEAVYAALRSGGRDDLDTIGAALGLAVGSLGIPD